jgi:cell division protein FtsI (penicillin-binding protein 3)
MSTSTRTRPSRASGNTPVGPPPRKPFKMANSRRRMQVMIVVFAFILSLFASRLVELQVIRGDELAESAVSQRLVTDKIPADRGTITDVKGRPLATSVEVRDITADQTLVDDPAETAAILGPMVDMRPAELEPLLTGERRFINLKKKTRPQVWRDIKAWQAVPENDRTVLQGIFSERRTIREYPNGQLAANLVGFTNNEGKGAVGLENGLDNELAGTPGTVTYERSPAGTEIPTSQLNQVKPVSGSDVKLTLDADLQWTAQEAITKQVKETGSDFGMVVALEVGTGRILAMATGPSFDPAEPEKVEPEMWTNRPVSWAMEPGSTAKLMTIAAVINEGVLEPTSPLVVPGGLVRGGKPFRDSHEHGTLNMTLAGVLAESSNLGTILASEKIGGDKLYEYLKGFGVGEPSGLQAPGEQNGYIIPPDEWSATTFPTLAFGQGMSLTALQITNMVATIGNDGVSVPPRLIDSYQSPDGTVRVASASEGHRVLTTETARTMQEMMQLVVQEGGTAANVQVPGYLLGGKTGTAYRYDEECSCYEGYTASFVGMAPADKPQIVVGAWLDHPSSSIFGGELAGPVVEEVMTAALASQGIPPTGGKPAKFPLSSDGSSGG